MADPPPVDRFSGQYAFLSNVSPHGFQLGGWTWRTVEHAFHGYKTLDPGERERIAGCGTWRDAKALGRRVVLRPGWDMIRKRVMNEVVLAKFGQNDDIRARLVATGNRPLIEGNTWCDNEWGDCRCGKPECARAGLNWLGQILMHTRFVFQAGSYAAEGDAA